MHALSVDQWTRGTAMSRGASAVATARRDAAGNTRIINQSSALSALRGRCVTSQIWRATPYELRPRTTLRTHTAHIGGQRHKASVAALPYAHTQSSRHHTNAWQAGAWSAHPSGIFQTSGFATDGSPSGTFVFRIRSISDNSQVGPWSEESVPIRILA